MFPQERTYWQDKTVKELRQFARENKIRLYGAKQKKAIITEIIAGVCTKNTWEEIRTKMEAVRPYVEGILFVRRIKNMMK